MFGDAAIYPPGTTRNLRFWVYYSAKNINATAGSRTAINANLPEGGCLVMDKFGHDQGIGFDFTQPQTSHLDQPKVIVRDIPRHPDNGRRVGNDLDPQGLTNQREAGWIWAEAAGMNVRARVANGVAVGDYLGPTNGSFDLSAKTSVASLAAIHEVCGQANEANSSGSAAIRSVRLFAPGATL